MNRRNCFTNFHLLHSNSIEAPREEYKSVEVRPKHSIRFDVRNHLPVITATSVRCKNENCRQKTNVFCDKCKVHLCIVSSRNCFTKFHFLNTDETEIQ